MEADQANEFDIRDLREAFGKFATGVTVITTRVEGEVHGMTANSFTSVSMGPPMLLVCVSNKAKALEKIKRSEKFGVSVLAAQQQSVSNHFAGKPQFDEIVFASLAGIPTIKHAIAQFGCTLVEAHLTGDHTIMVGKIDAYAHCDDAPLLYQNGSYRELVMA